MGLIPKATIQSNLIQLDLLELVLSWDKWSHREAGALFWCFSSPWMVYKEFKVTYHNKKCPRRPQYFFSTILGLLIPYILHLSQSMVYEGYLNHMSRVVSPDIFKFQPFWACSKGHFSSAPDLKGPCLCIIKEDPNLLPASKIVSPGGSGNKFWASPWVTSKLPNLDEESSKPDAASLVRYKWPYFCSILYFSGEFKKSFPACKYILLPCLLSTTHRQGVAACLYIFPVQNI